MSHQTPTLRQQSNPIDIDLDDLGLDVHHGSVDFPDIDQQMPSADNFTPYGVNFESHIRNISVDKYESTASTLREYFSNMAATCLETIEYLDDPTYQPTIHVSYHPDSETLVIEDNGMGFDPEEFFSTATETGVTTNIWNKDRGGRFGIGLFSGFEAVTIEGVFFCESRSRRTGESVKGLWTAGGFIETDQLDDNFGPEQYGSRFEFPLTNTRINVRRSVKRLAQWCRIPILYTEYGSDGSIEFDEDYGNRSNTPFIDNSRDDDPTAIVIETGAFRAVHHRHAKNDTVILDAPTNRNDPEADNRDLPFNRRYNDTGEVDVLFHSEDQDIVAGPHAVKARISDNQYSNVPRKHRDEYVPASQCSPADVWTPALAGDRDRLETDAQFWDWLSDQLNQYLDDTLTRVINHVKNDGRLADLRLQDVELISEWMTSSMTSTWSSTSFQSRSSKRDIETPTTEISKTISTLSQPVDIADRWTNPWNSDNRTEHTAFGVDQAAGEDGGVWISSHPSERMARVVWADSEANIVARAPPNQIDDLVENTGWNRLSDVSRETLDQFDITDDQREEFLPNRNYSNPNAGAEARDRVLTLHWVLAKSNYRQRRRSRSSRGYIDQTRKRDAQWLRAYMEATQAGRDPCSQTDLNRVVLIPSNSDELLSDHLPMIANSGTVVANCSVKTWEYLQNVEGIDHIDDALTPSLTTVRETSEGEMTLSETLEHGDETVVQVSDSKTITEINTQARRKAVAEWLEDRADDGRKIVYVNLTTDSLNEVLPFASSDEVTLYAASNVVPVPESTYSSETSPWKTFVNAHLPRWQDTAIFKAVADLRSRDRRKYFPDKGRDLVQGLARQHDAGEAPPSEWQP